MELRDYQTRAVDAIRAAFGQHRAVCLALQVGGGKTVIACEVIRRARERGRRCLFLVHRVELVEQARDRLAAFGIEAGIIKAGFPEQRDLDVQVACIPTLIRRENPPAELVIFDECHHAASASWLAVLEHYREAGAWILGITATPQRLDGKPLAVAFDTIIEPVTTRELVYAGYLVEPVVLAPPSINRKGLKIRGGDYALPELVERMAKLTGSITDYWESHARDKLTLAFACNVEHSKMIEEALRERGARVAHVDGSTPKDARADVNRALRSGDLDVVTNCMIWTEGFDLPELGALIVARPTASLGLHRQMVGRVMRPPGPVVVLDHAGNHHVHGMVTDDVAWSLEGKPKKPGEAPVRTCGECFAIIPLNAAVCPNCGAEPEAPEEAEQPQVENPGVLVKFSRADKSEAYRGIVAEASMRGYKLGWARMRYKERFGVWPRCRQMERDIYRCAGHEWQRREHGWRVVSRCGRCFDERVLT